MENITAPMAWLAERVRVCIADKSARAESAFSLKPKKVNKLNETVVPETDVQDSPDAFDHFTDQLTCASNNPDRLTCPSNVTQHLHGKNSEIDLLTKNLVETSSEAEGQGKRSNKVHPSEEKPMCLRNISTGHVSVDSFHLSATESMPCSTSACMGSLTATPSIREPGSPRSKEDILKHAKQFFDQYYRSIKRFKSRAHEERWNEVIAETEGRGTYELRETELIYGAKLAWRNAPRCIGRIQWSKLQ
ncbi:nitric oxide synthase, salivary gland-like, partial [Limulus polyphemus]|uniref:nitric-oxide synthase (NADPH) n=1 Tax=Limulus polyphemus TaxID=6850 RepID=A0ABM1TIG9_LIMPO